MANKFLIKNPIISEKASRMTSENKYVFLVADDAVGPEIKKSVEAIYKVLVDKVSVINVKSKKRRLGGSIGTKPGYKKAIVTLKKGHKLDLLPK